jgi:hypothetical protein
MRNGQNNNKRMRGRNRSKGGGGGHHHHYQNPLSRMYESNGQDVKIRGTASHIAEKYLQLARDAQSSGDSIACENYYQHAEHYFRLIAAAQEQLRQSQPFSKQQPGGGTSNNLSDDGYDDGDNDQPSMAGEPFAPREPQAVYPREQQHNQPQHHQQYNQPQHYQPQNQPQPYQPQQHQPQHNQPQHQPQPQFQPRPQPTAPDHDGDVERLPSFITGGQPQQAPQHGQGPNGASGQNGPQGQNNGFDGPDRFPLHRRRRRHRGGGPRDHALDHSAGGDNGMSGESDGPPPPSGPPSDE